MKILNLMFSKGLGGIEQCFIDYATALKTECHDVCNVTSNNAAVNELIDSTTLPNYFSYDPISIYRLHTLIQNFQPHIIIAHGNRAINFAYYAKSEMRIPLVGVAHNYKIKHLITKTDYIFSITNHLKNYLLQNGYPAQKIFVQNNMIQTRTSYIEKKHRNEIPVIGTMGRFVHKKGFDIFLEALSILKKQHVKFYAIIGGDGEEKKALLDLRNNLNLVQEVEFIGWVNEKEKFFDQIDIFCLPSRHEPFGIIILEAMNYAVPIIASDSEGPGEILEDQLDSLIYHKDSAEQLASNIYSLIKNPSIAKDYAQAGFSKLQQKYDINAAAQNINQHLSIILKEF